MWTCASVATPSAATDDSSTRAMWNSADTIADAIASEPSTAMQLLSIRS
jgi:hypothetical protein